MSIENPENTPPPADSESELEALGPELLATFNKRTQLLEEFASLNSQYESAFHSLYTTASAVVGGNAEGALENMREIPFSREPFDTIQKRSEAILQELETLDQEIQRLALERAKEKGLA